jgi:hypothetical protein
MSRVGSIVVDLLLKTGSFETDIKRARRSVDQLGNEFKKLGKNILGAFGIKQVGDAMLGMVRGALESADAFNKLSQSAGVTAEAAQELAYAFELGGVSNEEFRSSLTKLNRSISEAAQGTQEQADAFKVLGISATKSDGSLRGVDDVLGDIAEQFAKYKDGPEKAALAMAFFGKTGANLIPTLNLGRAGIAKLREEAQAMGIVVSGEVAKQAEEFNDQISRITKASRAFGNAIVTDALPVLSAFADELVRVGKYAAETGGPFESLARIITGGLQVVLTLAAQVGYTFDSLARKMAAHAASARALLSLNLRAALTIQDELEKDQAAADAKFNRLVDRIWNAADYARQVQTWGADFSDRSRSRVGGPQTAAPRLPGTGPNKKAAKDTARSFTDYQGEIQQAVASAITSNDVTRVAAYTDQIALLDKLFWEFGLSGDVYDAAMKEITRSTTVAGKSVDDLTANAERLKEMLAATPSAALERDRKDMLLLADALEKKDISQAQYLEAVTTRLGIVKDETEKGIDAAHELGMTFSSAFEDAIVQGGKLSDVIKGLEQDILRIITRRLVTEPLTDWFTKSLQGLGTSGGGAGGGAGGGFFGFLAGLFGPGKAAGGPVSQGKLYEVNEGGAAELLKMRGRTYLLPGSNGRVVPATAGAGAPPGAMGGGGASWSPTFNLHFAPGTTEATANQAGAAIARRLRVAALRIG